MIDFFPASGFVRACLKVALYRVSEQGWDKEQARQEMVNGAYNYHRVRGGLLCYLKKFDPK